MIWFEGEVGSCRSSVSGYWLELIRTTADWRGWGLGAFVRGWLYRRASVLRFAAPMVSIGRQPALLLLNGDDMLGGVGVRCWSGWDNVWHRTGTRFPCSLLFFVSAVM